MTRTSKRLDALDRLRKLVQQYFAARQSASLAYLEPGINLERQEKLIRDLVLADRALREDVEL